MAIGIIAGVLVAGGLPASNMDAPATDPVLPISAARALAHNALPGAEILEAELEDDDGRLAYEFEMRTPRGLFEVEIDAVTGRVIEIEIEDEE